MYLKSRFKSLPSVFLAVAIFTVAWVPPPPAIIMLAISPIIEMAAVLLWNKSHTSHPRQLSVLFREFPVLRILYRENHTTSPDSLTDGYLCYFQYFDITNIAKRKILWISFYIFVNFPLGWSHKCQYCDISLFRDNFHSISSALEHLFCPCPYYKIGNLA